MGSRRQNRSAGNSPLNSLERIDWEWLELREITEDPRLQMRLEGLDEKHVRDLMATVEDKGIDDPITVVREGKTLWLADGFHRAEAYRRVAGENWPKQKIKAIVLTGTFDDAKQLARKANLRHGKPLSSASRKAILFDMVRGGEEINGILVKRLSNGALAAELGVHQGTIGDWFKELFSQESTSGFPLVTQADRDVVYGRDGREIRVAEIASSNRQAAEEERKRKAIERMESEARTEQEKLERYRGSNVIFRAKYVADMLLRSPSNRNIATYVQIDLPPENTPDELKTCGYYVKAGDKRFRLTPGREESFIHDFQSTKDIRWYQELLSRVTPAIWEQAESQDWDEAMMQQWLDGFRQRQSAPLPSQPPRPGMAPPKNNDLEYQPPTPLGRKLTTPPAATEHRHEPTYNCPLGMGQRVWVLATGASSTVMAMEWVDAEWRVWLEDGANFHRLPELTDTPPALPVADDTEPEINTNPTPCPFKGGDLVVYKPSTMHCQVITTQWDRHAWWLDVVDTNSHDFRDYAAQFERIAALMETKPSNQSTTTFRTGDIVRDTRTGQLGEVVGVNRDGSIRVESDDEDGEPYQYDGSSQDFEKYVMDVESSTRTTNHLSNGNRQAEVMIEDARSLLPRLLVHSAHASADYRLATLVQWEAPKSAQTILEAGDSHAIHLLKRDLQRARGEFVMVLQGASLALDNIDTMLGQIEDWATL